ncbi:MAG TPA: hypothetical protein VG479_09665 [Gaiellaceae bacterium]|jgi:hypothetical protein|nr:hypothetical protein [Gaiellaceae bacterium]
MPDSVRHPLGEVLVATGLLTPAELDRALAEQAGTGRPLGQVLVEAGLVPRPLVDHALVGQEHGEVEREGGFGSGLQDALVARHRRPPEDSPVPGAAEPAAERREPPPVEQPEARESNPSSLSRPLGELLAAAGLVTEDEVAQALAQQERDGGRLGEILVARRAVSRVGLDDALVERHHGSVELETGFGSGLRGALAKTGPERPAATASE